MYRRLNNFIFANLFVLCTLNVINAQPELDVSFNLTGRVMTDMTPQADTALDLAVQPDNKIVMIGISNMNGVTVWALVRYNTDGSLDSSFGDQGRVFMDFDPAGTNECPYAVTIQPDGKIIAAGYVSLISPGPGYFAMARFNPDGTLDTTFNSTGKVKTPVVNHVNEIRAIALAPDGKIVVAGHYYSGSQNFQLAVARYLPNGTLDGSFGSGGIAMTHLGFNQGDYHFPGAVIVQPDGKIITGGTFRDVFVSNTVATFMRFNVNGTMDTSFNGNGTLRVPTTTPEAINDIALLPDGKIMAAGTKGSSIDQHFLLTRINSNGTLDNTFDGDGRVITPIEVVDTADSLFVDSSGRMIVTGTSRPTFDFNVENFAVACYHPDGTLDTSFSGDGKLVLGFPTWLRSSGTGVGLDSLGRIVVGGFIDYFTNTKFAVARLYTRDPVPVSIYGRTLSPSGQPIVGMSVGLTDRFGVTRWTLTSPFGYYQFDGVMSGQTVTLSVSSKRYLFDPKDVGVNENLADVDLVGVSTQNRAIEVKPDRAIKEK